MPRQHNGERFMQYENPVIPSDYPDPDVIRVGSDFYMVTSSFNYVPAIPVLHSKNLVEWELINHVADELPFERFSKVCHGDGAWAPSLRFHNGKFYCLVPFPDEGIYVAETTDIYGKWSPLRPLIKATGVIDPCPIWADGKCYVAFAFARSRTGDNSQIAVFEADENLTYAERSYKIIFDGHDTAPTIEGPKFYRRGGYYYVLAPAGGVKSGWQVALRSKNIYGPYESKIILMQGDTDINGPHQGALIDLNDSGEEWAFMHFQDMGAYGRVMHLQPAVWVNDWPLCGLIHDVNLAGVPVSGGEYPVDIKTDYCLDANDDFKGETLSPIWQSPANRADGLYEMKYGLKLNCAYYEKNALGNLPHMFLQKPPYFNFSVTAKCRLHLLNDGDEAGFIVFGKEYLYTCVVRRNGQNFFEIRKGNIGGDEDETIARSQPYADEYVKFHISVKYEDRHKMTFKFTSGGSAFTRVFEASPAVWTGARMGIYARSDKESKGYATFKYFKVTRTDGRFNTK